MDRRSFSLEVFGDRIPCGYYGGFSQGDNTRKIEAVKKMLRVAMEEELTQKQYTVVECFYFKRMKVTEIAQLMGVNKSTVSRHLKRSAEKLKLALKYGFISIYS